MSPVNQLSEQIADLVTTLDPSLVTVLGRRPATGAVWSEAGLILTADHAVSDDEVHVRLWDGRTLPARLVGRDASTDLALLQVDAALTPAPWGDPPVRVGHLVFALGRPRGTAQATLGLVSAVGGPWRTGGGGQVDRFLDVDASLPRGFSGGVLVGADGVALGLNTAGLTRGGTTVPTATLRRVVGQLQAHGGIQRAWLGVSAVPGALPPRLATIAGQSAGLLVAGVEEGSPADQAGLDTGDVLLGFGATPLGRLGDLLAALSAEAVGVEIPVRLLRAGAVQTRTVTPGARPATGC